MNLVASREKYKEMKTANIQEGELGENVGEKGDFIDFGWSFSKRSSGINKKQSETLKIKIGGRMKESWETLKDAPNKAMRERLGAGNHNKSRFSVNCWCF